MSEELPPETGKHFPDSTNSEYKIGYKHPPLETRFQPGNKMSPGRPPNIGLRLIERLNELGDKDLDREGLEKIVRGKKSGRLLVAAANFILSMSERADLADFEPLMDGQMNMRELRNAGFDTAVLKKCNTTERMVPDGKGGFIREVKREIESHERSMKAAALILDQTNGKPVLAIEVNGPPAIQFNIQVVGNEFLPPPRELGE